MTTAAFCFRRAARGCRNYITPTHRPLRRNTYLLGRFCVAVRPSGQSKNLFTQQRELSSQLRNQWHIKRYRNVRRQDLEAQCFYCVCSGSGIRGDSELPRHRQHHYPGEFGQQCERHSPTVSNHPQWTSRRRTHSSRRKINALFADWHVETMLWSGTGPAFTNISDSDGPYRWSP